MTQKNPFSKKEKPFTLKEKGLYKSAEMRLFELGPVVSTQDLILRYNLPESQARSSMSIWAKAGKIARFGPSVAFNTLFHPKSPEENLDQALHLILRRGFVCVGGPALYHSGWTNQVHHGLDIAVPVMRGKETLPKLNFGVRLIPRSVTTFHKLKQNINQKASGPTGIPVVDPAYALADAFIAHRTRKNALLPTPADEIDKDYLDDRQVDAFYSALKDLGASTELITEAIGIYQNSLDPESEDEPLGFW